MARITCAAPHLSAEEVKGRMLHAERPFYRQRWMIIYQALVDPREAKDIAKHTGASVSTVHKLIANYNKQGVSAIETKGKGGRYHAYLSIEEEQELLQTFFERAQRGELTTVQQIKHAFEEKVGHTVDETTIQRLIKRHQWRKVMPRPFHPQADKEEQERFQQNFPQLVEDALQSRDPTDQRKVLKMAQDEGCFGRLCTPSKSWAPKGVRPLVPRQIVREYVYVYASVAPEDGILVSLILPRADTEMMNIFLEHVSHILSEYFIVMQVDQAGWHHAKDLVVPENIRLIAQPSSSPELNPTEHIWDEIREKAFANRSFETLDAVVDTLCDELLALENNPKLLRSMTYFPHFRKAS